MRDAEVELLEHPLFVTVQDLQFHRFRTRLRLLITMSQSFTRRAPILNQQELITHLTTSKILTLQDPASTRPPLQTPLRDLSWSPYGNFLATSSSDKVVRIWNPDRPLLRNTTELRGHTSPVLCALWSPAQEGQLASIADGGAAAAGSPADHHLRLWDMRSGKSTRSIDSGRENCSLAWSPDGNTIAVGNKERTVRFFDVRGSDESHEDLQLDGQHHHLIWSHSGRALFVAKADGNVDVIDWPTLAVLHTIQAHTSACLHLTVDSLGEYLAIGGNDAMASLWDTTDWMCMKAFSQNEGPILTCSFSFDSSFLATGTNEGASMLIFHVESGQHIHSIGTNNPPVCVRWHPSRYILAYLGDPVGMKLVGVSAD